MAGSMTKTFSDKVREEIEKFDRIYADFQADYEANRQKACAFKFPDDPEAMIRYELRDPWRHLFHAPIESIGVKQEEVATEDPPTDTAYAAGNPQAKRLERPKHPVRSDIEKRLARFALEDAQFRSDTPRAPIPSELAFGLFLDQSLSQNVLDTVRRLKLNEKRLGGIATDDWRVSRALNLGLLSVDDLEPLYSGSASQRLEGKRVNRPKVDGGDPFFWRALLEVFCRAFLAETGRPKEWPAKRIVSLAFDLVEIDQKYFKESERSNRGLFKKLREHEPYKSEYWDADKAKWKVSLDAVNKLMKDIKPKDNILRVLERVKLDHETEFFAETDKRFPSKRRPKTLMELNQILDSVERSDRLPR
jgi:hypothetical protein